MSRADELQAAVFDLQTALERGDSSGQEAGALLRAGGY